MSASLRGAIITNEETGDMLQKNKTKAKLKAGEVVFGSEMMFPSADVVEILGYAGLDFVYMDTEHSATTHESLTHMIRAAEISGTTPLVRIPENLSGQYPGCIMRILDIGAMGVIVPHVDTKEEAQAVVDSVKYYPQGKRGANSISRQTGYGLLMSPGEYVKEANQETMVVIMIESGEGVKNLPDILSVKGIDVVQIGSSDLAQSLGYTGRLKEPVVLNAIDRIIAETRRAGVAVGVGALANFEEKIKDFLDAGVQFVNITTNKLITSGVKQWREWLVSARQGR
jgi:4-hydroxy-2-oxoheptanedioate aldolase